MVAIPYRILGSYIRSHSQMKECDFFFEQQNVCGTWDVCHITFLWVMYADQITLSNETVEYSLSDETV